eukprot:TRINITY_DN2426_c0_g1_i1.p2 TRINITY_DN2426_c0_g1~~TRINITY_DN2426_c0_g1_i1.p2  ORF type:complete len:208 (+),score=37.67 TRINITY_DN2426_c0_g1_i1:39-662(+)
MGCGASKQPVQYQQLPEQQHRQQHETMKAPMYAAPADTVLPPVHVVHADAQPLAPGQPVVVMHPDQHPPVVVVQQAPPVVMHDTRPRGSPFLRGMLVGKALAGPRRGHQAPRQTTNVTTTNVNVHVTAASGDCSGPAPWARVMAAGCACLCKRRPPLSCRERLQLQRATAAAGGGGGFEHHFSLLTFACATGTPAGASHMSHTEVTF